MKYKTLSQIKAAIAANKPAAKPGPAVPPAGPDVKKSFMTVPYFTPSDDLDIDSLTDVQRKKMVQKGKLMAYGTPVTITRLRVRKDAIGGGDYGWADALKGGEVGGWFAPEDFSFDAGTTYHTWIYTWIYLALTVLTYVFVHPLVAVIFAWKTGHNWGHYIGALIFGKEDMKGKVMYRTA